MATNAALTTKNLLNHSGLFQSSVFALLAMYLIDIVLAWAVYSFLKPVHAGFSLLAAWFRLVYIFLAMAALLNYVYAFELLHKPGLGQAHRVEQVLFWAQARSFAMNFAYLVSGMYLILVGLLIYQASYVPKLLGVISMLAGIGWMMISLQPSFVRGNYLPWMMVFSLGEMLFKVWLLVEGTRINDERAGLSGAVG